MSENIPTTDDNISQETESSAYTPQEKTVPTNFCVIMFVYNELSTEEETTELIQLARPNIDTSLYAYTSSMKNQTEYYYHQSISNDGSYYLIPLEEDQELNDFSLFGFDQGEIIGICSLSDVSEYGEQIVTDYPYTFYYYLFDISSLEYYTTDFTITDTYLDMANLPIPDISDYPLTIIPVSKNTIVTADDTNQSYIYTDNGWQFFANNTENITAKETELFIRGLIYNENIEDESSGSSDESGGQEK